MPQPPFICIFQIDFIQIALFSSEKIKIIKTSVIKNINFKNPLAHYIIYMYIVPIRYQLSNLICQSGHNVNENIVTHKAVQHVILEVSLL